MSKDEEKIDEIIEELALNYDHKDCSNDCTATDVYKENRKKLDNLITAARKGEHRFFRGVAAGIGMFEPEAAKVLTTAIDKREATLQSEKA